MKFFNFIFNQLCLLVQSALEVFTTPPVVHENKRPLVPPPPTRVPIKKLVDDEFVDMELEELLKLLNRYNK